MGINFYERETLVRFAASFTNTVTGAAADPGAVILWLQDPNGNQSSLTLAGGQVVRTGVGQYYCDFAPDVSGRWIYKWQGTAPAEVTSSDTAFIVNQTAFSTI